ncbi:HNH endonuclease [Streptomyces cellulosae]|uniref:HNH endonuclease n=1 Tax=Streptomyces cellulosae TaxID=1968 RepID=UPI002D219B8F|nr:HNH endonuclease [Streptomyces cellulosae]
MLPIRNIDHVRPRSRGGSNRISNLVLACVPCNQAKGNTSVETFLAHRPEPFSFCNGPTDTGTAVGRSHLRQHPGKSVDPSSASS